MRDVEECLQRRWEEAATGAGGELSQVKKDPKQNVF